MTKYTVTKQIIKDNDYLHAYIEKFGEHLDLEHSLAKITTWYTDYQNSSCETAFDVYQLEHDTIKTFDIQAFQIIFSYKISNIEYKFILDAELDNSVL